jgi:hypothetical protein
MKLALASSVGAAAEALEAHIDFHLGAGVDAIFIGASRADVPERLVRRTGVHVVERADELLPAAESGADWVIEGDVNEFWWPRGGTLKELLELIAPAFGSVQALPREFVPVKQTTEAFSERMIHRLVHGRPQRRHVRRTGGEGDVVRGWFPIEVLRFPVNDGPAGLYDEPALRRGVEQGVLSVDTRIRDALRVLAAGRAPEFGRADPVAEARFAADLAALSEADVAQTRDRIDELEERLSALESSFSEVVKRKLRGLKRPS